MRVKEAISSYLNSACLAMKAGPVMQQTTQIVSLWERFA
jgi:hypothetical protein